MIARPPPVSMPWHSFHTRWQSLVMKRTSERRRKAEVISFDISDLSQTELREMFCELPVKSLKQWMNYYVGKEQYEICKVIKEYIDLKSR